MNNFIHAGPEEGQDSVRNLLTATAIKSHPNTTGCDKISLTYKTSLQSLNHVKTSPYQPSSLEITGCQKISLTYATHFPNLHRTNKMLLSLNCQFQ
jgi:hypothetical protein